MSKMIIKSVSLILLLFLSFPEIIFSRASIELENLRDSNRQLSTEDPAYCIVAHRIGKMELAINNNGTFGTGFSAGTEIDCITGAQVASCEYPKNSNVDYLFAAAFWIGAVVKRDTLVSEGADGWSRLGNEFSPDIKPFGDIVYRSIRFPDQPDLYENAVSEEDYICVYTDTFIDGVSADYFGARPHMPLNIEVTQRSYAWSYPYAEDFVLFDYEIKNIGTSIIRNTYMGIYNDGDVGFQGMGSGDIHTDDICGFIESLPTDFLGCQFIDTVNIAWIADNDGDMMGAIDQEPSLGVTATRIVRTPADVLDVSFNWWISNSTPNLDYGPRERAYIGKWLENFRDFRTTGGVGTPEGDVNKYYLLRNREFDFDQIYSASIQPTDTVWLPPNPETAGDLADGFDTRYLLSFGPFDINPGEKLPISFAYVAGENLHRQSSNIDNLPDNPDEFYKNLDFTDLGTNAIWASRVYDNPGLDSDSDGYAGEFRICVFDSILAVDTQITDNPPDTTYDTLYIPTASDTSFYVGDGIPDFQGASPPPAPVFWLTPKIGSIHVRFNGFRSETTKDIFSRVVDFEGYRIYVGRDKREGSFSMVASFDIEDYNKYVWNEFRVPEPGFELKDIPFTLNSLRNLYGANINPLDYPRSSPFFHPQFPDSIFYFEPQDFNASEFGVATPIKKIYPNQPYPSVLNPEAADTSELTEDGYLKYFEYEFDIENLLPTVQWWVNVTAFDFGSPISDLKSLETPRALGAKSSFAQNSYDEVVSEKLKVFIYPNPYRLDANYRDLGFEGRSLSGEVESDRHDDRVRVIHFVNLPPKCTIKIFTLDGDLVREIIHDKDPSDPEATHDIWNLITRNTQLIVSGIYYWTIESDNMETQIGKLVIIM